VTTRAAGHLTLLHLFDGATVEAKKHQGIQIPLNSAFAARLVFAAFDATPRFAGRSHGLEWRTIFLDPDGVVFLTKATNNCNNNDLLPCEAVGMEKKEVIVKCIRFRRCASVETARAAT